MKFSGQRAYRDESGVALITVVGIAFIGMVVATVVVASVMATASFSGRDRVRTTEIHSAEAALDATLAELEVSSPCSKPTFSPATYGTGNVETVVTVTIEYYDAAGTAMTSCTGTMIDGIPKQAIVTAHSVSSNPSQIKGVVPERTLQTRVNLEPRFTLMPDAAIYSASSLATKTGFTLSGDGDIWIEGGSWTCGNRVDTDGSVFIPNGSLTVTNSGDECSFGGSLWVEGNVSIGKAPVGNFVETDLTVKGNVSGANVSIGGDARIGGSLAQTISTSGVVRTGLGTAIKDLPARPLPQVTDAYFNSSQGFTVLNTTVLKTLLGGNFNAAKCELSGTFSLPAIAGSRITYDFRGDSKCSTVTFKNATMTLQGDLALLANGFAMQGTGLTIKSDGGSAKRNLWVIVPWSTTAASTACGTKANDPYTIYGVGNSVEFVDADVQSFWYTPGGLLLGTAGAFNGQAYGKCVELQPNNGFNYTNVGIPGLSLGVMSTLDQGFNVEIVYKREVS